FAVRPKSARFDRRAQIENANHRARDDAAEIVLGAFVSESIAVSVGERESDRTVEPPVEFDRGTSAGLGRQKSEERAARGVVFRDELANREARFVVRLALEHFE